MVNKIAVWGGAWPPDTSTGDCFLVSTGTKDNLDEGRLQESWVELAGWLYAPEEVTIRPSDLDPCEDDADPTPCFTTCEEDGCERLIMIIDGGAPEFCGRHEEAQS